MPRKLFTGGPTLPTPGPWRAIKDGSAAAIVDPKGRLVATASEYHNDGEEPITGPEALVNATLIAAVQDLYGALEAMLDHGWRFPSHPLRLEAQEAAAAAIAKADGV